MNNNQISNKSPTIFFFGAGSSAKANVPTTFEFARKFEAHLKEEYSKVKIKETESPYHLYLEIKRRIKNKVGYNPDIEQIYELLNRLLNTEDEIILSISDDYKETIDKYDLSKIESLINDLKKFIKVNTHVEPEKTNYLKDLRKYISSEFPVEIYTTNYDNVIEQFCSLNDINYTDGFKLNWEISSFEEDFQLNIYKIHGSLSWYQTRSGKFIKIPLLLSNNQGNLQLQNGEKLEDMLMYPMLKLERPGPLLDLMYILKSKLYAKSTRVVVVVGYSFRDDYLKMLFLEALKNNKGLHLVIISPSAIEIKKTLLKDDAETLGERIICYTSVFEQIIENLYDISSNLTQAIDIEKNCKLEEIKGYSSKDWDTAFHYYFKSSHFTKMHEISHKDIERTKNKPLTNKIMLFFVLAIGLYSLGYNVEAIKYEKLLHFSLKIVKNSLNIFHETIIDGKSYFQMKTDYKFQREEGPLQDYNITSYEINQITENIEKINYFSKLAKMKILRWINQNKQRIISFYDSNNGISEDEKKFFDSINNGISEDEIEIPKRFFECFEDHNKKDFKWDRILNLYHLSYILKKFFYNWETEKTRIVDSIKLDYNSLFPESSDSDEKNIKLSNKEEVEEYVKGMFDKVLETYLKTDESVDIRNSIHHWNLHKYSAGRK